MVYGYESWGNISIYIKEIKRVGKLENSKFSHFLFLLFIKSLQKDINYVNIRMIYISNNFLIKKSRHFSLKISL